MAKKEQPSFNLGPWPFGQNTVQPENAALFQARNPAAMFEEKSLGHLTKAVNVDFTDDGWPQRRSGTLNRVVATAGLSSTSFSDWVLLQDGGTLYRINTSTWAATSLVTGLTNTATLHYAELGGVLYWTNGVTCGLVTAAGTASNWGMSVPPVPTLSTVTGTTPAGRYQVAVTYEDAAGRESGAPKAALVTLTDATKNITVTLSSFDASATHVNIYASEVNQPEVFWVKRVAVGALPATILPAELRTSTRPLRTQHLRGPIPADGLFTYQSFLMMYRDAVIFRSRGLSPHLFHPREDVLVLPSDVLGGVGLAGGFWVSTAKDGLWWFSGEPGTWRNERKDGRAYAAGAAVISGSLIPSLQTSALVALFVNEDGLVAGLPTGNLVDLTDGRLALDVTSKTASIVYHDTGQIGRVLFSVY